MHVREIASSYGYGIAQCIAMLDHWQQNLAYSMANESDLHFREHVKESMKKGTHYW